METQPQQPPAASNGKPAQKFRVGRIHVSLWANQNEHGLYYSATFERRYKDASDQWQSSGSFGYRDLLSLAKAADQAFDAIAALEAQDAAA